MVGSCKFSKWGACLGVLLIPAVLWAQVYSGSLTGVVTDPSGALVTSVKIILTDVNKGFTYTAQTDDTGRYLLRSLPPGTYKLAATAPGFKASVRDGIVLNVDDNSSIDIKLEVGAPQETIQVVSEAPLLSTQDASTGQVLNRNFVNDLPLLGRNALDLLRLAPGVSRSAGASYGTESNNNIVVNGSRNSQADVLIDGVTANITDSHGGVQATVEAPDVDAVQEFKIQTNFGADVAGFSGNSVINLVIRSGTNSFHGSAYEFFRNDKLNANDWFNNRYGNPRSPTRWNQFGGTFGGPIRKNKTFFFFDEETVLQKEPGTVTVGVPSEAMRQGNFAEICAPGFDASGMCKDPGGQLWDPYSAVFDPTINGARRSAFIPNNDLTTYMSPGNPKLAGTPFQPAAVPGNLIDPVAAKMMTYYPLPNINVGQPNYNRFANFFDSYSNPTTRSKFGIKVDQYFSEKDRLSGRFTQRKQHSTRANIYGNALDPYSEGLQTWNAYSAVVNYTHVFSPTLLLNVSMGYITNPVKSGRGVIDTSYPDFDISKDLGFPEYMKRSGLNAVPEIGVNQYTNGYQSIGNMGWGFFWQTPETHDLNVSLNKIRGRHDLKFGWEGRLRRVSFLQPTDPVGNFSFSNRGTSQFLDTGGDAMATFLTGLTGSGSYEMPARPATQSMEHAGYIQDNWRVNSKLTLNLGLRYDLSLPRTERFNHMNYLDPNVVSPLQVPELGTLHGGLIYASAKNRHVTGTDYNNFGPRFGFAYSLRPNFVLRGGYGIYYVPTRNGVAGTVASGFQGFSQVTNWTTSYQGDDVTPALRLSDPFPGTGPNFPIYDSQGLLSFVGQSVQAPFKSVSTVPYEQSWNFGVQREIPGNIALDLSYVGMKGTHLYYGGAEQMNHLPEVAGSSLTQITALTNKVANPFYGVITDPTSPLSGPEVSAYQLQLPYPQFTGFSIDGLPAASSIYHAFQMKVEKRLSRGLQFLVTYTLSKSIDDSSLQALTGYLGGSASLQDPNNRRLERGLSQFDATHVLNLSYVYDLPFGRGQLFGSSMPGWLNAIAGGWKTNGIWQFASGQPLGLTLATQTSIPTYSQRPDLVGTLRKGSGSNSSLVDQYFANPEVAVVPALFALGTAPRTMPNLRAPGINIANLSLFKNFGLDKVREGMRIEYRAEFINAFNHPHFAAPDTSVNDGTFGQIFSTTETGARQIQMALKFYF